MDADAKRLNSIKAQSQNLFGKNFPQEYQTPSIQRNVKGFNLGDDLHHRAILSVYEPFFSGLDETSTLAMVGSSVMFSSKQIHSIKIGNFV